MGKTDEINNINKEIESIIEYYTMKDVFYKSAGNIVQDCIQFQQKLSDPNIPTQDLYEIKNKVINIKIATGKRRFLHEIMPSVSLLYIATIAAVVIFENVDFEVLFKFLFGENVPIRVVFFGMLGAFIYYATNFITEHGKQHDNNSAVNILLFGSRLLIACFVPAVLVYIFFDKDGHVIKVINVEALKPELIGFFCGYSAQLVVDIFNMVLDKISKTIKSL